MQHLPGCTIYTELAQLPLLELIEYLRRLIQRFHQVYIMMDALVESPRNAAREDVLNTIETMRKWSLQGLHLFVTSRG